MMTSFSHLQWVSVSLATILLTFKRSKQVKRETNARLRHNVFVLCFLWSEWPELSWVNRSKLEESFHWFLCQLPPARCAETTFHHHTAATDVKVTTMVSKFPDYCHLLWRWAVNETNRSLAQSSWAPLIKWTTAPLREKNKCFPFESSWANTLYSQRNGSLFHFKSEYAAIQVSGDWERKERLGVTLKTQKS